MANNNYYGGVIWTNHALDRLTQRNLDQNTAFEAFSNADRAIPGKKAHTTEFQKKFDTYFITVIATKNEKNEWVILSCWVDPPLPGSIDIKKRNNYLAWKKASGWKKVWLVLKKQLGM
jgi:hypothetical protein